MRSFSSLIDRTSLHLCINAKKCRACSIESRQRTRHDSCPYGYCVFIYHELTRDEVLTGYSTSDIERASTAAHVIGRGGANAR